MELQIVIIKCDRFISRYQNWFSVSHAWSYAPFVDESLKDVNKISKLLFTPFQHDTGANIFQTIVTNQLYQSYFILMRKMSHKNHLIDRFRRFYVLARNGIFRIRIERSKRNKIKPNKYHSRVILHCFSYSFANPNVDSAIEQQVKLKYSSILIWCVIAN